MKDLEKLGLIIFLVGEAIAFIGIFIAIVGDLWKNGGI